MAASWKNRIGVKLFGLLTLVIFLTMVPLAYKVLVAVNTFGVYSATINEDQIKQQAVSYLARLSKEQGYKYEEYFSKINMAATLMAVQAREVYNNIEISASFTDSPLEFGYQADNEMFLSPLEDDVFWAYWGDHEAISEEIDQELKALMRLDPLLMKIKELFPDLLATHMITVSGIGKYHTWNEEAKTAVRHLPPADIFDLRDGAPLTIFSRDKWPTDRAQWTAIYKDDVIDGLMVTASGAIVDNSGTLRGIIGIDLPLQTIVNDVLLDSRVDESGKNQILFSFLVDSRGQLIAFPESYLDTFGFDFDPTNFLDSADQLDYKLKDSKNIEIRNIATAMLESSNTIIEFNIDGEEHYIATQSLPSLGWTFALVTRQTELVSSVERIQNALRGTLKELKREFALNSFAVFCLALCLVYFAVRYFVGPLQKLAIIAQKVGDGDLTSFCEIDNRNDELGALGAAMNDMINRLSVVEELRINYSNRLEKGILSRTVELEKNNCQLEVLVDDLQVESEKRRSVTQALQESEKQLRSIMESSLAGLCIIQNKKFCYVNTAIPKMFGYSHEELLNGIIPGSLLLPQYRDVVNQVIGGKREAELHVEQKTPFHVQCRRKDGHIFHAQVEGVATRWGGQAAIVGTIIDISSLKKTENKLRIKERRLSDLLDEKNILLREVYHRTKNNMLVIISMLALQMDSIEDESAKRVFVETENRIRAMAMVHENLYRSENLANINLGEYLENMVRTLISNMTIGGGVKVFARYCPVSISFDQAIPLGLIVNELVTNSVKHAFGDCSEGDVRLEISETAQGCELIVADNGIGIPLEIDAHNSSSFGLQITANMIEKQVGASFRVLRDVGTQYIIELPYAVEKTL